MAELLTTKEILAAFDNLIKKAEKYICIFTYNIRIDPGFLARIRNASKRNVSITIVFGVNNGSDNIIQELLSLPNCNVYFKEYMHAKFFYSEKELLLGSMNLSEASAKNNFELGVLFKGEEYSVIIRKVKEEAKEIISDATEWKQLAKHSCTMSFSATSAVGRHTRTAAKGHCIRCKVDIQLDTSKPLCIDCYHDWAEWENDFYPENYCHSCGKEKAGITIVKPECYNCYNDIPNFKK